MAYSECFNPDSLVQSAHYAEIMDGVVLPYLATRRADATVRGDGDRSLFCSRFDSYAEARNSGETAPVTVSLLESGTQLLYRDKRAVSLKCSKEELKPVRILDTEEKSKFFHAFIIK